MVPGGSIDQKHQQGPLWEHGPQISTWPLEAAQITNIPVFSDSSIDNEHQHAPPPSAPMAAHSTDIPMAFGSNMDYGYQHSLQQHGPMDVFPGGLIQKMNCSSSRTPCLCSKQREICSWAVCFGAEAVRAPGCHGYLGTTQSPSTTVSPPMSVVCRAPFCYSVPPLHHTYIHPSSVPNCSVSVVFTSQIGLRLCIVSVVLVEGVI